MGKGLKTGKMRNENGYVLKNEVRDSGDDWFYWAFCAEGAAGKELTFQFDPNRIGCFGPAFIVQNLPEKKERTVRRAV